MKRRFLQISTETTPAPFDLRALLEKNLRVTHERLQAKKEYQDKLRRGEIKELTYGEIRRGDSADSGLLE